jgi:hypothetical protein
MRSALRPKIRFILARSCVLALALTAAGMQQSSTPTTPAASGATAHYDRMAAAKTVFLKNIGGDDVPFNVISRNFEGWSHYVLVDSPDKADLIIEIRSPCEGSADKEKDSEKSKTNLSGGGQQNEPPKPTVDFITLTVYDKNKRPMWIGREEPKFAVKHKGEEERLVDAAQKLFTRFHDRIEPPPKP